MLAVAASAHASAALPQGGGYVVPRASHLPVTGDAPPGRILLAEQQVMSLRKVHHSYTCDFASHPNTQLSSRLTRELTLTHDEPHSRGRSAEAPWFGAHA